ncbi:MAG: PilN domain-containing protein [Holophagaceae bacterium]|nr:PilN domain-containing protein [Holophagaceae bacterium]
MAVPVLQLNLAPRPSLWRQRHKTLGWTALGLGAVLLIGSIGFTWRAYSQASRAGRDAVSLTEEAKRASRQEQQLQSSLQDMDAGKEQSRWKLAEKILQERSLPWSRLTAELEQCMVPDMRLKGIQRARSNNQQVLLKLKGEARTREAEAAFVESLRATPVFAQVVLERESERAGGGWDFELSLPAAPIPPPFQVKVIKQGVPAPPMVKASARPVAVSAPIRPASQPVAPPVVRPAPPQPAPATEAEPPYTPRRTRVRPASPRIPQ